jgi:hypothetical protein
VQIAQRAFMALNKVEELGINEFIHIYGKMVSLRAMKILTYTSCINKGDIIIFILYVDN